MSLPGQGSEATGMGAQSLRQFEQAAMDSRLITVNSTAPKLITLDPLQNFMIIWGLSARDYARFARGSFQNLFPPGVFSRRQAYISEPEGLAELQVRLPHTR